jgi:hypothetical protein
MASKFVRVKVLDSGCDGTDDGKHGDGTDEPEQAAVDMLAHPERPGADADSRG